MKPNLLLTGAIVVHASVLWAQAPTGPARIAVTAPLMVPMSASAPVSITLQDSSGKPTPAATDTQFRVSTPDGKVSQEIVTVPKGSSTAQFSVSRDRAGLSELLVDPVQASSALRNAVSHIAFAPPQPYKPVLPLSVTLAVTPRPQLLAGLESATVIARLLDKQRVAVPAAEDIEVSFPGLREKLSPHPLRIAAGSAYAEAMLSSSQVGRFVLEPLLKPSIVNGRPVGTDRLEIEFVSQIVGLRLLADPRYVKGFRRPEIKVKVGLINAKGNWIASDEDRTVILRVDPPTAGRLRESDITITRGTSVSETTYRPYDEGTAKIETVGTGLLVQQTEFEFRYVWTFFLLIAAIAGVAGGVIRQTTKKKKNRKLFIISAVVGAACGALAYVLAPLLIRITLRPENLQNASKVFEAFAWGFVGGGGGPALLAKVFTPNASPE